MTDTNALKKCISDSGISISFIAHKMGISREGFYKKMNGETEFKASEICSLKELLGMTNAKRDAIFFADEVEYSSTIMERK